MIYNSRPSSHLRHLEQKSVRSSCADARLLISVATFSGTSENSARMATPVRLAKNSRIGPIKFRRHCFGFLNSGRVVKKTKNSSRACATTKSPILPTVVETNSPKGNRAINHAIAVQAFLFGVKRTFPLNAGWKGYCRGYAGAPPFDCIRHDDHRSPDFSGPMVHT